MCELIFIDKVQDGSAVTLIASMDVKRFFQKQPGQCAEQAHPSGLGGHQNRDSHDAVLDSGIL